MTGLTHDLLCGHWTFFRLDSGWMTARCDLPPDHHGLHKFWWNPETGESFSWADVYEKHDLIVLEANDRRPRHPGQGTPRTPDRSTR